MNKNAGISCVNMKDFLAEDAGMEAVLREMVSDYRCPANMDVEKFLKNNAIDFTKKNQSVTYIALSDTSGELVGYFSLSIKPIVLDLTGFSKTMQRKLGRIKLSGDDEKTVIVPAYLIAQIGKNYGPSLSEISGQQLMDAALETIKEIQYKVGGNIVFLESVDNEKLLDFYSKKNGFKIFAYRTKSEINNQNLIQMLKLM